MKHLKLVAALSAALLFTGCAASSSPGEPASSGSNVFTISESNDEPSMLVRNFSTAAGTHAVSPLWSESLVLIDENAEAVPGLATDWTISDDGLTYTFTLQDGVEWHDGEPFTADDVVFTLSPDALQFNSRGLALQKNLASVEAVSDTEVVLTLSSPLSTTLKLLGSSAIQMLPAHIYEGTDLIENEANQAPIGTGPYKFKEWERGQRVVFEKNENYWKDDQPSYDQVVIKFMSEDASINAILNGEVDYVNQASTVPTRRSELRESDRLQEFTWDIPATFISLGMNTEDGHTTSDLAVRQAIAQAVDRDQIVETALSGEGAVAETPFPTQFADLIDPSLSYESRYPQSADEAKKTLKKAGHADGAVTVDLVHYSGDTFSATANVLKAQLAEAGIEVNIIEVDEQTFSSRVFEDGDFDLYLVQLDFDVDPAIGVDRVYSCDTIGVPYGNGSGWCDEEAQQAFATSTESSDPETRFDAYQQASKIILDEVPSLNLAYGTAGVFISSDIEELEAEYQATTSQRAASWSYSHRK